MKIVVSSFALPQEMDELQRLVCQLKRAAASLSGSHEFFFDVTLATSPRLIDWTRSSLPLAFFADRLAQLERMSDWATTHFRVSDAVLGALTHRIHSFDRHPDADYFLWIDPDIVFTDQALAILEACLAELAGRHRHLILTPEIVRLWDETWDCLVNPAFLDQPLGYHGTHDPFADSGIKGVVSLRPVVNGIPGQPRFKFASGWFTTLSMDLLKRTGLPRSFGPYGPEDSFIMCAAEKLLSLRAADVAQFKISNFVVCEDYRYRSHAHYLRHLATHDCKQTFRALSERNFPYELDRLGRSGWEDPGFMMTTDDVHAVLEEAVALHRRGEVEPAERRYRAILERDPEHPRAVHNLGLLLLDGGRVAPSLPLLEWAVAAESTRAAFWNTLGRARSAAGDAQRAADCFERALALDASGIDAAINLGNARFALGQLDAAAASYEAALRREPGAPEAVLGLGAIAQQRGQFAQAMSCYRETLRAFPESGDVHASLGAALLGLGRFDEALRALREALRLGVTDRDCLSALLWNLQFLPVSWDEMLAAARHYGDACRPATTPVVHDPDPDPARRIRLGYVSGDFGEHAVGHFIAPLLRHHDATAFEVFCYETRRRDDAINAALRAHGWRWRSLEGLSDDAAEHLIRGDGIDILIDLSGHTQGNRLPLFARRPAPVQIGWFGYRSSRGLPALEHLLVTPRLLPPAEASGLVERPLYLPDACMCFDPLLDRPPAVAPPPVMQNGCVTFGAFHKVTKLAPELLGCWASILRACPDARLYLKDAELDRPEVRQRITTAFGGHGIGAERLILEAASPRAEYHTCFDRVDISLDPFPYRGGAVTFQSLWMGVPVLTLERPQGMIGHYGAAILAPLGLDDWIATDADDYVARACRLAADPALLAELRAGLRQRLMQSAAGDGARFVRQLETLLREVWRDGYAAR